MNTELFWQSDFGDDYTRRNRVDWRARKSFWERMIERTGARSAFEFGANAGWNLSAIRSVSAQTQVYGCEINTVAQHQAFMAGLAVSLKPIAEVTDQEAFDLTFTCGVLIHIAPEDLHSVLCRIISASADYVLAVEYAAEKEEPVVYRGHAGKLWRRPYGGLYQSFGLKLVETGDPGPAFDRCTYWLLRK